MTRVSVDAELCTGHGRCYTLAPDVFDADEVGHCVLLVDDVETAFTDMTAGRGARSVVCFA